MSLHKRHRGIFLPMDTLKIDQAVFKEIYSNATILERIKDLALQIERDLPGSTPVMLGVMKGSVIFLADLVRAVTAIDLEIDYVRVKSYGNEEASSGTIELVQEPGIPLMDRDVVVVEDIVDSGQTVNFLRRYLSDQGAKSVRVATLLYKHESAKLDVPVEYVGFSIPNNFVIGYGLDYKQLKRNLPSIYSKQ